MTKYLFLFCILLSINLTAHNELNGKLPNMLQQLEKPINEKQKVVDHKTYVASIALGMSCPISLLSFSKDPFYSSMGKISAVTFFVFFLPCISNCPRNNKRWIDSKASR